MSSSSPKEKLSASENGSPVLLSPARSEMSNGDAESVSPRSEVSSEQSLTTQVGGQMICRHIVKAVFYMSTSPPFWTPTQTWVVLTAAAPWPSTQPVQQDTHVSRQT